jgi:3-hydroxymyristoyl/3-hydroxydecanoyl-(acyl carrier protein) dehydratase
MSHLEYAFRVANDHPALPGHFPGNPIVPGVLLLDQVIAALQKETGRRVVRLRQAKFESPLRPDEWANVLYEVEGQDASFRVTTIRDSVVVRLSSGSLSFQAQGGPSA